MHVHIVGVAGAGMGPLAGLLAELGHKVTGSDIAFEPPIGPALERWGVTCLRGFDPAHLDAHPDLVVIGNVCRPDNPEAVGAFQRGLDVTHMAGALQRFVFHQVSPLVVAGTHGKTTTSCLCAWLLDRTGSAPGFLVGGLPKNFERSFRAPRTKLSLLQRNPFVIEGDEYDTAFFEKTAKFLHYRPQVAIITSIEHDHIDIYPSAESYENAFRRFVEKVPEDGLIVAFAGDARVVEIVSEHAKARVVFYALQDDACAVTPEWIAAPATQSSRGISFELFVGGMACGRFSLSLSGDYNLRNAVAALAATALGYGVSLERTGRELSGFLGVSRRQELVGVERGVFVYSDFAHHPTAVRETLRGLRQKHPGVKLFAAFEPRSATACRRHHQADYALSFDAADTALLAPVGRRELPQEEQLDLDRLCRDLRARNVCAERFESVEEIVDRIGRETKAGDVVVLLSNGTFGHIQQKVLARLAASG